MNYNFYKTVLAFSTLVFMLACSEDNLTGDSTKKVSSPTLSVELGFTNNQTLIEQEREYNFTVSISEPQIVNVIVYLSQISGTATNGEDFTIPESVTIPIGSTSVSGVIAIHEDDLAEETETAVIKIVTSLESNVNGSNSETATFNIQNYSEGDLLIDMTWSSTTDFTDNLGNPIADEDIADLILYVTDPNIPSSITYLTIDEQVGFESLNFIESFPDGEFNLVAGFFSAANFGGNTANLDISLTFNQAGIINDYVIKVPAALNTANADCQTTVLAKLTKSGSNFSFEQLGVPNNLGIPKDETFAGMYSVTTTSPGQFGSAFSGNVTIVDEGNGVRSFMGDWNDFGLVRNWEFAFNPACGTVTFLDGQSTGLGCGGPAIILSSSANAGVVDPGDDSSFSVTFTENSLSACGGVPTTVTIMFTKL